MLTKDALNTLFSEARTHNGWLDKPVTAEQLQEIYDLMKWGPTSANSSPARIVFVTSATEKEKLLSCMAEGNLEKTKTAPVTAIIGMDMAFYDQLPTLFPHADARSWFAGNQPVIDATAFLNSSLQGAYLMLAARAVGLDCGAIFLLVLVAYCGMGADFGGARVSCEGFAGGTHHVRSRSPHGDSFRSSRGADL